MSWLKVLAAIEGVEEAVIAAKIPVISTGFGGAILSLSLFVESEIATVVQDLQAAKTTSPAPSGPVTPIVIAPAPVVAAPVAASTAPETQLPPQSAPAVAANPTPAAA